MTSIGHKAPPERCPNCSRKTGEPALNKAEYVCPRCGFELAHLDIAPNGSVRGLFGFLLAPDTVLNNRYRIQKVLGKGGFGATYLAEDLKLDRKRRALKEIPELLFDEQEAKLLSRLSHHSIPDIVDRFRSEGMIYLVLEFGGSRTLATEYHRCNGRFELKNIVSCVRQLGEALRYIHSQTPPIIHRDLKPDNILIDDNDRIMLVDFGIAKQSDPNATTRVMARASSHGFSPPEQVLGTGTDERSDIYSFGATLYFLLTGKTPPAAHERIAGQALEPPLILAPELVSPRVNEILLSTLCLNVNQRPSRIEELQEIIDELTGILQRQGSEDSKTVRYDSEVPPPLPAVKMPIENFNFETTRKNPKRGKRREPMGRRAALAAGIVVLVMALATAGYILSGRIAAKPAIATNIVAYALDSQALVSFTPPPSDGGNPITSYVATSAPGGLTAEGTASPITVKGLNNGTSYTFTVTAKTAAGLGQPSGPSNSIVPATLAGGTVTHATPPSTVIDPQNRRLPRLPVKYWINKMLGGNAGK